MALSLNVISNHAMHDLGDSHIAELLEASLSSHQSSNTTPSASSINSILQTTLDIEQIITLFDQQITPLIPHEGINYYHANIGFAMTMGQKAEQSCNYQLIADEECLGEISLMRSTPFTADETYRFKHTLYGLLYPLRNAVLYHQAKAIHKDGLTGLFNHTTLEQTLDREIKLANRYELPLSAIILDIDQLKPINDHHTIGKQIIKAVAQYAVSCIRTTDTIFRYAGETLVIILNNTELDGAHLLAERIRKHIHQQLNFNHQTLIPITISAGVASLHREESQQVFLHRANQALSYAKSTGTNGIHMASDLV